MATDLSTLSDAQLRAMYDGGQPPQGDAAPLGAAGMTDDQLRSAYAAPAHPAAGPSDSFLGDIPRRVGTAAIDAATGILSPVMRIAPMLPSVSYQSGHARLTPPQASSMTEDQKNAALQQARDNAFNATGVTEYLPSTEGGRIGQAALTAGIGGAAMGGGVIPSIVGGAVGQTLAEHTPLPPLASALLGQVAGSKGASMATGAARPFMPGAMDPETLALARRAQDFGITVPLAKASNNPFVRYLDSAVRRMPFSGYGALDQANQAAFNKGLAGEFGEDASKITPETLNSAYDRLGNVFSSVGVKTSLGFDDELINDLANAETRARGAGIDTGPLNAIQGQINKIQDVAAANGGVIPGDVYQNIIARKSGLSDLQQHGQGIVRDIAGDIRDALDGALQRSASPEDVAALQQARTQYKALKTVEPLTMRSDALGNATPSTGDISPPALLSRVNQQYRNAARAELGDLPLKDLAQIGQRFLKEPPSSGSAERLGVASLMRRAGDMAGGLLVGGGATGAHEFGVPLEYALPPLAAMLVGPPVAGAMLRSPSFVQRQINGPQYSPLAQILAAQPAAQRISGP